MPEGPEVETIRRTLHDRVVGQSISSVWRSEFAFRTPSKTKDLLFLVGDRIAELSRFAKVLILETDNKRGVMLRLGMSGRIVIEPTSAVLAKHTHLRIGFEGCDFELRLIDARRFGDVQPYKTLKEKEEILAGLGPDALSFTPDEIKQVARVIKKSQREIKVILLDQNVVSSVGNIYACEALFVAKIAPTHKGCEVSVAKIEAVLYACQEVMSKAVVNNGTSFMSYFDGNGRKGSNQHHLLVFGREGESCDTCKRPIKRIVQAARSTFYCSYCQT